VAPKVARLRPMAVIKGQGKQNEEQKAKIKNKS
jgi:hypothetical protein